MTTGTPMQHRRTLRRARPALRRRPRAGPADLRGTCRDAGRRSPGAPRSVRAGRHHRRGARACPASSRSSTTRTSQRILDGQQFIDTIPHRFRAADGRHAHHPAGQARVRRPDVRDHRRRGRRRQAGRPARAARRRRAVRHRPGPRRGPRHGDPAGDRRRLRRAARRRHPAGDALQDHDARLAAARTLGAARRPARRHRRDLRLGVPRLRLLRRRPRRSYYTDRGRREQLLALEAVRSRMQRRRAGRAPRSTGGSPSCATCSRPSRSPSTAGSCSAACRWGTRSSPRSSAPAGPNTQINAACASTTQALSLAEDWIRAGRCRRVVVVVRRRRHQRRPAALGRRRLPGLRRGGDRRRRSRTRPPRSTAAGTG